MKNLILSLMGLAVAVMLTTASSASVVSGEPDVDRLLRGAGSVHLAARAANSVDCETRLAGHCRRGRGYHHYRRPAYRGGGYYRGGHGYHHWHRRRAYRPVYPGYPMRAWGGSGFGLYLRF